MPRLSPSNPEILPLEWILAEETRRESRRRLREAQRNANKVRARCVTLAGFVREAWHIIEPDTPLVWNWHLDAICAHLQAISEGRIPPWLIINVPPGSSKSTLVAVMWQAWEWGPFGRPGLKYLTTSFEEENVKRDTRKTRKLIRSEWYQALWPMTLERAAIRSFENERGGTREGVPFGSVMGKRGDRVVIDDPHSLKGAESEVQRAETVRLFLEGGLNRVNNQLTSAMVVVMQRVHEGDLTGALLAQDIGFQHLMIPMEFEPERACKTAIWADPRAADGELMDPHRFPPEAIEKLRKVSAYSWAGQYQQRPAPRQGAMFKRHWFEFVRAIPAGPRRTVRGWDLAGTKRKTSAYTAGVLLTLLDGVFYIENAARAQTSPGEMESMVKVTASQDGGQVRISIPQDPGQSAISQKLALAKLLVGYNVRFSPESGDKEQRAEPVSAQAEAGNFRIVKTGNPATDAWIDPFLEEVTAFPAAVLKDQVDALSRAFMELTAWARVPDVTAGLPLQVGAGPQFVIGGINTGGAGYAPRG